MFTMKTWIFYVICPLSLLGIGFAGSMITNETGISVCVTGNTKNIEQKFLQQLSSIELDSEKSLQEECFKKLSTMLPSITNAVTNLDKIGFDKPQVIMWATAYDGRVKQGFCKWLKLNVSDTIREAKGTCWLIDLNAWSFLSSTREQLLKDNQCALYIEEMISNNNSLSALTQCPLQTFSSKYLKPKINKSLSWINVLGSNQFFSWLENLQGRATDLEGLITENFILDKAVSGKLGCSLRQLNVKAPFLDCISKRCNGNLLDVDCSQIFPLLQYLEGIFYVCGIVNNQVEKEQTGINIAFLIENKEFAYYLNSADTYPFESFEKNLAMIVNQKFKSQKLSINVRFQSFAFGKSFEDGKPYYQGKTTKNMNNIISLLK